MDDSPAAVSDTTYVETINEAYCEAEDVSEKLIINKDEDFASCKDNAGLKEFGHKPIDNHYLFPEMRMCEVEREVGNGTVLEVKENNSVMCEYEKIREIIIEEREKAMKEVLAEIKEAKDDLSDHTIQKRKSLGSKHLKTNTGNDIIEVRRSCRPRKSRVVDVEAKRTLKRENNLNVVTKTSIRKGEREAQKLPPLPLESELFIPPVKKMKQASRCLKIEKGSQNMEEEKGQDRNILNFPLIMVTVVDEIENSNAKIDEAECFVTKMVGSYKNKIMGLPNRMVFKLSSEVNDEVCAPSNPNIPAAVLA